MTKAANNIIQFSSSEQVSEQKSDDKPWLRQKNEPATSYMHFRIYLDMGRSRSLRKALAVDRGIELATIGDKELRKIHLPGSWSRAAKIWRWKERAEAYDLSEIESQSAILKTIVGQMYFCSPAYRICELHSIAIALQEHLNRGSVPTKTYLALSARLQSVLKDIAAELANLSIETTHADARGLEELIRSGRIKFE